MLATSNARKKYVRVLFLALFTLGLCLSGPASADFVAKPSGSSSSTPAELELNSAIAYVSKVERENFPIFSTLVRTYRVEPRGISVTWPNSSGPVTYWGGGIVNMLSFTNIVMLVYDGETPFGELVSLSRVSDQYRRKFISLFDQYRKRNSTCYFERYTTRHKWITKGVIIADVTRAPKKRGDFLLTCASAGAGFVDGLPFASNVATLEEMPALNIISVVDKAIYDCALQGETNIKDPEKSKDGLYERPSKACVINTLSAIHSKARTQDR